jgi:hypothetical protein
MSVIFQECFLETIYGTHEPHTELFDSLELQDVTNNVPDSQTEQVHCFSTRYYNSVSWNDFRKPPASPNNNEFSDDQWSHFQLY